MPDSKHVTLAAGTVTTVTLDPIYVSQVEVMNRGDAEVWVRLDGTNPAVEAEDSVVVPAKSFLVLPVSGSPVTVKLISTGTPKVSVRGF